MNWKTLLLLIAGCPIITASSAPLGSPDVLPDGAFAYVGVGSAGVFLEEVYSSHAFSGDPAETEGLDDLLAEMGTGLTFDQLIEVFNGEVAFAAYDGARFGRTGEVDEYGDVHPVIRKILLAEVPANRTGYESLLNNVFDGLKDTEYDENEGETYRSRKVDITRKQGQGFEYSAVKITEEYETRYAPDDVYKSKEVNDIYIGDDGGWFVISDEERTFEYIEKVARGTNRLSDDYYFALCAGRLTKPGDLLVYVNLNRVKAVSPDFAAELMPSEYDETADRVFKAIACDVEAFVFATSSVGEGPAEEAFAYIPGLSMSDYGPLFGEPEVLKGPGAAPAGYGAYVFYSSGGLPGMLEDESIISLGEAFGDSGVELASLVGIINSRAPGLVPSLGGEVAFCYSENTGGAADGQSAYFPDKINTNYIILSELIDADAFEQGLRRLAETDEEMTAAETAGPAGTSLIRYELDDGEVTFAVYDGWVYAGGDGPEVERAIKEVSARNVLSADAGFCEDVAHLSGEGSALIYIDYSALAGGAGAAKAPATVLDLMLGSTASLVKPLDDGILFQAYPYAARQFLYDVFAAGSMPSSFF